MARTVIYQLALHVACCWVAGAAAQVLLHPLVDDTGHVTLNQSTAALNGLSFDSYGAEAWAMTLVKVGMVNSA